MEKKQMLTGLYFIPTNNSCNTFDVVNKITRQLGYLNCLVRDNAAIIEYTGLLSKENKEILTNIAEKHHFIIAYIEAEHETPFANDSTIHIPTDNEMKEHLKLEEKVNHP